MSDDAEAIAAAKAQAAEATAEASRLAVLWTQIYGRKG